MPVRVAIMYLQGEYVIEAPAGFPTKVTVDAEKWEEVTHAMVEKAILLRLEYHKQEPCVFDFAYGESTL